MAFPEGFIQELKMRNDITEVISPYVSLKRRGRNMVGLCPFHGEKTPSFNVYTENGSFYCFGCGAGGDVITFMMKIENLDYVEAVKALAQRAGMDMPEDSYDDSMSRLRSRVYEANREAARYFYKTLYSPNGAQGLDYFHSRQLSDRTIRHFGLGFADDEWSSLSSYLKDRGFTENELVAANLAVRRKSGKGVYDRFKNRVMFPIIDLRGNVIAFGGRIMTDEKPKYLNTSDTPVFKKSENLFSLNNAKNSGTRSLILCEGYMDVIAVNQAGFQNAVATLGTALTTEQAMLMKRYADEVIICYDSDEAGQKATSRAIPILRKAGLLIRILTVPGSKDPDEFIKSKGADGPAAFKALIEKSGNDVEYRLQKLRADYNLDTPDGRVRYLEAAAQVVAAIYSPIERDVYISRLCKEFSLSKDAFVRQVASIDRRNNKTGQKEELKRLHNELNGRSERFDPEKSKRPRGVTAGESLIAYLVANPDSVKYVTSRIDETMLQSELLRRYYTYITDRLNKGLDPLNNINADFADGERDHLYRILYRRGSVAETQKSLDEYIDIIKKESQKLNKQDIKNMTPEQILEAIGQDKKRQQGG